MMDNTLAFQHNPCIKPQSFDQFAPCTQPQYQNGLCVNQGGVLVCVISFVEKLSMTVDQERMRFTNMVFTGGVSRGLVDLANE